MVFSYNKVRDYDYSAIYDLVRLSHYYEEFRLDNVLYDAYDINQVNQNLTSHSNLFKTDSNYTDIIIPTFEEKYNDEYDGKRIADFLKIFEK